LFRADSGGNLAQIGLIFQTLGKGFLTLKLFRTQIVSFLSIENFAVFYYVEKTCPGGQKCIRLKIKIRRKLIYISLLQIQIFVPYILVHFVIEA
jgi:hypothetical protein